VVRLKGHEGRDDGQGATDELNKLDHDRDHRHHDVQAERTQTEPATRRHAGPSLASGGIRHVAGPEPSTVAVG
jgi:hypothetical protein